MTHSNKGKKSVAVIILNYNGGQMLRESVFSVESLKLPNVKTIVVDNASADGSASAVKAAFPDITLIENSENYLFCKGCNIGIEYALSEGFEYIFLLNNDAKVMPETLTALTEYMDSNPRMGGVQPLLVFEHDLNVIQSAGCRVTLIGLAWDHLCGQPVENAGSVPFSVPGITGGAMFLRSEALRGVGGFAEEFEMYFEDVDLSLRLRKVGWDLACIPQAKVSHIRSATTDKLGIARRIFYCERNSYAIVARHLPLPMIAVSLMVKCPLAIAAAFFNLIKGKKDVFSAIVRGLGAGLSLVARQKKTIFSNDNSLIEKLVDRRIYPPIF